MEILRVITMCFMMVPLKSYFLGCWRLASAISISVKMVLAEPYPALTMLAIALAGGERRFDCE
jgi:hypothetical protein